MREYKFKRGYEASEERLEEFIKKFFESYRKEGNIYIVSFKAIKVMKLWIEDKKLYVETETDPNVPDDIAIQTIKTYNKFLEELTGYTAKERARMMKKELE